MDHTQGLSLGSGAGHERTAELRDWQTQSFPDLSVQLYTAHLLESDAGGLGPGPEKLRRG